MILFWIAKSFDGFPYHWFYGTLLVSLLIFLICLRWIRTALWARLAATAAILISLLFGSSTGPGQYDSPAPTVRAPIVFFTFFIALLPIVVFIGLLYIIWKRHFLSDLSWYHKRSAEKGSLITLKLSAR